jgi:ubiquitin carboxyl-terminal hydrolase 4/11/15
LIDYLLSDRYKAEINLDNPLGSKGELAEQYASLVKELWAGTHSAVAPRDFKWKLERFAPQFAGYQQHDSQELLAFLLDGLHEDLNRIKKKPYTENPEVGDRSQEEVAREAWASHRARNDSFIVDWFQGQLRSTLVCPTCARVSITFDPFMYLSLPLPMNNTRHIIVNVFFMDHLKKPDQYGVEVSRMAPSGELLSQ